jgi:hypothetical protein
LESYKVPLETSKSKNLGVHKIVESSRTKESDITIMGDREEQRNKIPNEEREGNERQINPRRRARSSPLNLHG